jgi:hypothetical protein
MPDHVFISYARADGKIFAEKLHDQLEMDGFTAWLDIRDIAPGKPGMTKLTPRSAPAGRWYS